MEKRSSLAAALVDGIGYEATMVLVRELGGKRIKVPDGSGRQGAFSAWLDENLGLQAAARLRATFGGEDISVPKLTQQAKDARNALIVADYNGGMSMLEMVKKYDLCERQLRDIINRPVVEATLGRGVVDDRQLGLF
jgi:hypothetical protein